MKILKSLYIQVLIGISFGIVLGLFSPEYGVKMKILGDTFINLLKMMIGPIIFTTVVLGVSHSGDMKKVGRVGGKALLYFETVSNFALVLGLLAVNIFKPGKGFNVDPASLDSSVVSEFTQKAKESSMVDFFLSIIPKTFTDAFTSSGNLLQILFLAVLFGYGITNVGEAGKPVRNFFESLSYILFKIVHLFMMFAPLGAFGAMAFTIGKYGVSSFGPLLSLMATFYFTCVLFIVLILFPIGKYCGFSVFRFIRYIKEELLTVLGTSSSESVLVPMMTKLEKLGCSKSVVGLVVPTVPVAGLALIFGIDRFMSEARALTNTIGNGVAAIVISRWEKELDTEKLNKELSC